MFYRIQGYPAADLSRLAIESWQVFVILVLQNSRQRSAKESITMS